MCQENNIPTANFGIFENLENAFNFIKKNKVPIVVKADGLAAERLVSICQTRDRSRKKTKEIIEGKFKSSSKVVLEEFIDGEELSYFSVVDEHTFLFWISSGS